MYPMHISGSISDIDKQFAGLWYMRQSAILQKLKSANLKFVGYANYMIQGSSLSTIFGILKKSYYVKFVLVDTT